MEKSLGGTAPPAASTAGSRPDDRPADRRREPRRNRFRVGPVVVPLMLIAGLAGCVSPAVDDTGYLGKVQHSAQTMTGIVGTARLAGRLELAGRLTEAVRDTLISGAENDAQSVLTSFETVQPPDRAMIVLRNKADTVLQQAASNMSDLRIATRAGDRAATENTITALSQDLEHLAPLQSTS